MSSDREAGPAPLTGPAPGPGQPACSPVMGQLAGVPSSLGALGELEAGKDLHRLRAIRRAGLLAPGQLADSSRLAHLARRVRHVPLRAAAGLVVGLAMIGAAVVARIGADWVGILGTIASAPIATALMSGPLATLFVGVLAVIAAVSAAGAERPAASLAALASFGLLTSLSSLIAVGLTLQRRLLASRVERLVAAARVVQAAVQPEPPPVIDDYSFAARYFPADPSARLGGDFYSVLETPFGIRLIIGDGCGSGLAVIHLAVAVLASFGELARAEPDLSAVARVLDRRVGEDSTPGDFVTAVIVELASDGTIRYVNCGHPDPIAVSPEQVRVVTPRNRCVPLGLGAHPVVQSEHLQAGERMLLFTDGVSECRDHDGGFFDVVAEAGALRGQGGLGRGVATLASDLRAHSGGRLNDDATLFAFEWSPPPAGRD